MDSFEAAKTIITRLREHGHVALLAGGCVRDRLLGLPPKDHDVATDAPPERVCALFRRTKQVGAQFGVVLVSVQGCEIEVATFRTDGDYRDGRRPDRVAFTSAEEDAQRRDFTINGMFYDPIEDRLVDYVGGRADLEARVIRCIGDAGRRFAEDHLRLLRAVRFAARLDFTIEPGTFAAVRACAAKIAAISPERVRMELEAILLSPSRARGWELIVASRLVDHVVHGVRWSAAEAERTRRVLAALPAHVSVPLGMAGMLVCTPPRSLKAACRHLRCSNEVSRTVCYLAQQAPAVLRPAAMALADLKMLLASGHFAELGALARAVAAADGASVSPIDALTRRAKAIPPEAVAPPPLLTGDDLLAMQIPPGPVYSRVLDEVYRAQLNEEIVSADQARDLARGLLDAGGGPEG